MKNKIITFLLLASFSGFGQITRTLPNVTNTADSMKPVSTVQKAAIVQKLHTVATISALQGFTDANVAQFDGSQWNKKSGNVASNGGSYAGTIINVSTLFYWERKVDYVTPKMFGAAGDGTTDDSVPFQNAINSGVEMVLITKGTYVIGDITVPSNVKITTNQNAINNWVTSQKVTIIPKTGASYIFNFATNAQNIEISNLYISCNNQTGLIAAIRTNGGLFHNFYRNNIVNCPRHALYINSGSSRIEHNNLQGLASTTLDYTLGFIGALHIASMGDSYILNNEVGGGSNYTTYKDPTTYRSVAVYANNLVNVVVSANIFEVADKAFYFDGGISCSFLNNRYEFCNAGGLHLNTVSQIAFVSERFTNNSNITAGSFDNLIIEQNSSGISFVSPIFNNLTNSAFTTKLVRYHISNKRPNSNEAYTASFSNAYFDVSSASVKNVNDNSGYYPIVSFNQEGAISTANGINTNTVYSIRNNPIFERNTNLWNYVKDFDGGNALYLGGTSDPVNYYNNNQHFFRDRSGVEKMRLNGGNLGINKTTPNTKLAVVGLPTYADNTTALAAGLTAGDFYRTATGVLMVTF